METVALVKSISRTQIQKFYFKVRETFLMAIIELKFILSKIMG